MITFNNIVERFKVFADAHFFVKSFSFGSPDDVDLSKFTSFPLMHLVYTGATYDAGTKTYNLEVYILDVPADKTKKTDRQKEVVSDAEQCAEDIIADIKNGGNIFLFAQDYEVVNANTTPLEEETKNVLSGVLLDLSVAIPYEWDACNAPIDGVSPEGGDEVAYARRGILRMLTVDGSTDVLSVRTIKVTNGTLTDDGDGVVTLDTGGAESLDDLDDVTITAPLATGQVIVYDRDASPRGFHNQENSLANLTDTNITSTPANAFLRYVDGAWEAVPVTIPSPPPSTTDGLPEGETNLYYTEARVSANTDVAANTAKVGITAQQAADITANNAKVGITPTQASEITANTAKVGITTQQADDITANNAKVSLIAGGTTGQALVKSTGTDYDVEWADIAVDVQYHDRFQTDAETFRSGATDTVELYYTAKADGDGLAESASSDTPAAGYDIRRKLYYSEAGFADPDTGTWTQFTAIADNTTFANAKAALLAYLKERTGGTVPISLKMTWEEVSQTAYLLDQSYGSGAEAAYSTRQLRNAATDCMVIRRASDSTTTTIGFVDGDIDEAAIETFCTGTTCTVYQWLDQSGNGNTATAAAPANEPTIYTGGALVKEGGKVAVDFNTGDLINTGLSISGDLDTFSVIAIDGADTRAILLSDIGGSSGSIFLQSQSASTSATVTYGAFSVSAYYQNGVSQTFSTRGDAFTKLSGQQNLISTDGTVSIAGSIGIPYNGIAGYKSQEIILYNSDKSTDRTSIEENIGDYFTQNTPLLDTYSGAAAAYSLRLLDSTYTGALVEVYNGSSYADIGANVFGELDTVALAAHCGSNDGFVSKWYDQAGSNDATQTQTASMPKIYDGTTGVVLNSNSKPAVFFQDGISNSLPSTVTHSSDPIFISAVSEVPSGATNERSNIYNGGGANDFEFRNFANDQVAIRIGDGSTVANNAIAGSTVDQVILLTGYNVSSSLNLFLNGTASASNPLTANYSVTFPAGGIHTSRTTIPNYISEIVVYESDQSSNRSGIESNIATYHGITI